MCKEVFGYDTCMWVCVCVYAYSSFEALEEKVEFLPLINNIRNLTVPETPHSGQAARSMSFK